LKAARAAIVGQVLVGARPRELGSTGVHVPRFGQLRRRASDLFRGVKREEPPSVGTYKSVPSDYAV